VIESGEDTVRNEWMYCVVVVCKKKEWRRRREW
jgi:hypothetical protein